MHVEIHLGPQLLRDQIDQSDAALRPWMMKVREIIVQGFCYDALGDLEE